MAMDLTFGAAILVGLLGSSHCIGMCGGIVAALNMGVTTPSHPIFLFQLGYNLGRISSYVLVGLAAGSLGAGLAKLGLEPVAGKLFAAAFMIALGLYLANWWRGLVVLEKLGARLWRHIQPLGQRLFPLKSPWQAYPLGLVWGWLPCGLVYAVVAWSLTAGNAVDGAKLMLGFGIGTLPAMLVAGSALKFFQNWVRSPYVRSIAGSMVIAFGLYSGYQGLSEAQHHHHHTDLSSTDTGFLQHAEFRSTRIPAILRSVS